MSHALPWTWALLALALPRSEPASASAFPVGDRNYCNTGASRIPRIARAARAASVEEAVSFRLPPDWRTCSEWPNDAAGILNEYGVVALTSEDDNSGLIDAEVCDNANAASNSRLRDMQRRIESRGLDPTGKEEMYRFSEIICRDPSRYDVPVAFLGKDDDKTSIQSKVGSGRMGMPLQPKEKEAIQKLHHSISDIAQPVIDNLWSDSARYTSDVAAAGFLINEPGSTAQNWHRDGPDEGFIDCFVPLIDLTESVGPTAVTPGTHTSTKTAESASNDVLVPLLGKGEMLLFDYRTVHRGQGNRSGSTTRTLAYAVYKRLEVGKADTSGDVHNFPAALTLEYD